MDASKKFEITVVHATLIKVEVEDVEKDARVIYVAKPIVINKP